MQFTTGSIVNYSSISGSVWYGMPSAVKIDDNNLVVMYPIQTVHPSPVYIRTATIADVSTSLQYNGPEYVSSTASYIEQWGNPPSNAKILKIDDTRYLTYYGNGDSINIRFLSRSLQGDFYYSSSYQPHSYHYDPDIALLNIGTLVTVGFDFASGYRLKVWTISDYSIIQQYNVLIDATSTSGLATKVLRLNDTNFMIMYVSGSGIGTDIAVQVYKYSSSLLTSYNNTSFFNNYTSNPYACEFTKITENCVIVSYTGQSTEYSGLALIGIDSNLTCSVKQKQDYIFPSTGERYWSTEITTLSEKYYTALVTYGVLNNTDYTAPIRGIKIKVSDDLSSYTSGSGDYTIFTSGGGSILSTENFIKPNPGFTPRYSLTTIDSDRVLLLGVGSMLSRVIKLNSSDPPTPPVSTGSFGLPISTIYFINTSSLYFTKDVEYTISSYLYNTSSYMDINNIPQLEFYLTKSWEGGQFPFESWESNNLGYKIAIASLKKQPNFDISKLTDDDTISGMTTDYMSTQTMQLIPKYSPIFFSNNFIPDFNGTASLLIYPRYGNWYFSEPSIKPFQTDNFNASEFEFVIKSEKQ